MVSRIEDTSPTLVRMPGISTRRLLQEPRDVDLLVNLGNDIEGLPVNPIQFLMHLLHVLLIESAVVGFCSVLLYRLPPNAWFHLLIHQFIFINLFTFGEMQNSQELEGHLTLELKGLCQLRSIIPYLVANAMTIQLHFTLELDGLRDQGSLNGWKPTCSLIWHALHNVSWSTGFCVKPTSKRWV